MTIGSVHTSDSPAYVPLVRSGGEKPGCQCGQPGCQCATTGGRAAAQGDPQTGSTRNGNTAETDQPVAKAKAAAATAKTQLSEPELAMVRELKQRDQHVRQHEMAHMAASGGLAQGGPNYSYQRGPDGQNYAVGGHVNLDISPGKTPEETLQKAQTIRAAAMAPSDPSGADRAIAARATQMESKARIELIDPKTAKSEQPSEQEDDSPASRLGRQILAAITPQAASFLHVMA